MIFRLINSTLRYTMAHTLSKVLPLYIVNEFPRSGGTWLGQMLADALQVPFPRNRLPMPFRSCIFHSHLLRKGGMKNVVILWRDGRDLLLSWYFYSLFPNHPAQNVVVEKNRLKVGFGDFDDVRKNLPAFIEYVYQRQSYPRFTWSEFVDAWSGRTDVYHAKYETLLADPAAEMSRIVQHLTGRVLPAETLDAVVAKNSFETQTGRKRGQEDKRGFARKGIAGDWRNYFSTDAKQVFQKYAGKQLQLLDYEKTDEWVNGPMALAF